MTFDNATVAAALSQVRDRISRAGGGLDTAILPVTKSFGPEAIAAVRSAGCTAVGENYVQEVLAKADALDGLQLHFIGQLQTNKVRQLAGRVAVYETVDRVRLVDEIARRDPGAHVLLQVDTAERDFGGSPGKGGCPLGDIDALLESALSAGLHVAGLMTVGPTDGGPEAAREGFRAVRRAVDRLALSVCSMGMSADLEVAVQEGSTQVRVGTALFGARVVRTTA